MAIFTIENDFLKLEVAADSQTTIYDKQTGKVWATGPVAYQDRDEIVQDVVWTRCERVWADYFIGRFTAEKIDEQRLRINVMPPPWTDTCGSAVIRWELDGPELVLHIEDIDESLPSFNYPPAIESASLVMPSKVGQWLRANKPEMTCYFATQNNGLNMRWVGGLDADEQRGWMMIFENGFTDIGTYRNNLHITPTFLKAKSVWSGAHSVRYCFTDNGYVGLAKRFRRWAQDHGLWRSLQDKMEACPALKKLHGGRIVSMFQCSTKHTNITENNLNPVSSEERVADGDVEVRVSHADAAQIFAQAKAWGMDKGLFVLRGTFQGGYDDHHPDIWPPEQALGTVDELKNLVEQDGEYLAALHDNYQDIYTQSPTFPEGVIKTRTGDLMTGGPWHGGLCFITCTKKQRALAERNWPYLKTLGVSAHFVDTLSCVRFYECFDEDHPMTRDEDPDLKADLMQFFKDQDVVLGSEEAADFGVPYLDWLENRHTHVPHESIPLWSLVFHDAAFSARYGTAGTSGGKAVRQLENALWGYMSYWPANDLASWPQEEAEFKASLAIDALHKKIGAEDMTHHQYLDDGLVEQTTFANGVSVIANFADEPRTINGQTIPSEDYIIIE